MFGRNLFLAGSAWTACAALAFGGDKHKHHVGDCCPADRTVTVNEVKLVEEQELIAVPQLPVRPVVTRVPIMGVDIEYKEEKRCVTVMVVKPREVETEVTTLATVPETTVDPCTGKLCITYKQIPICKTVKTTVYETVPETREYNVRVPVVKPVERAADVTTLAVDEVSAAATLTRLQVIQTPNEVTIPAPPCTVGCVPEAPHCPR
ncbi:MAG: hypothetical protein JNM56_05495 [Planctomycetia bacterium]|nr:hypothetical protein [Planctomycetia bacterium]